MNCSSYDLYRKDMSCFNVLSDEDETRLFKALKEGDSSARDILVYTNQRLVTSIAKKYSYLMPIEDLTSEGNMGLLTAIDKFDYAKGNKFSTYASFWITHEIKRALEDKVSLVRFPAYYQDLIRKYNAAFDRACKIESYPPSDETIKSCLDESFPIDKYDDVKYFSNTSVSSLNIDIGDDNNNQIVDMIPSDDYEDYKLNNEEEERRLAVLDCVNYLNDKEKVVMNLRVFNDVPMGLKEIGEVLGVSKERVRQIYEGAVVNLKSLIKEHYPELF